MTISRKCRDVLMSQCTLITQLHELHQFVSQPESSVVEHGSMHSYQRCDPTAQAQPAAGEHGSGELLNWPPNWSANLVRHPRFQAACSPAEQSHPAAVLRICNRYRNRGWPRRKRHLWPSCRATQTRQALTRSGPVCLLTARSGSRPVGRRGQAPDCCVQDRSAAPRQPARPGKPHRRERTGAPTGRRSAHPPPADPRECPPPPPAPAPPPPPLPRRCPRPGAGSATGCGARAQQHAGCGGWPTPSTTTMRSACWAVERRWAMRREVRPAASC